MLPPSRFQLDKPGEQQILPQERGTAYADGLVPCSDTNGRRRIQPGGEIAVECGHCHAVCPNGFRRGDGFHSPFGAQRTACLRTLSAPTRRSGLSRLSSLCFSPFSHFCLKCTASRRHLQEKPGLKCGNQFSLQSPSGPLRPFGAPPVQGRQEGCLGQRTASSRSLAPAVGPEASASIGAVRVAGRDTGTLPDHCKETLMPHVLRSMSVSHSVLLFRRIAASRSISACSMA